MADAVAGVVPVVADEQLVDGDDELAEVLFVGLAKDQLKPWRET